MGLEGLGCSFLIIRLSKKLKTIQAPPDEIKREDDVLLQSMPFVFAGFVFFLTTLISDTRTKVTLGLVLVLSLGTFYVFRAIGKIKSLPKYRFASIFFLVYLGTSVVYEIVVLLFPILFPFILLFPPILQVSLIASLGITVFLPMALVGLYFPRRYGVRATFFKKSV